MGVLYVVIPLDEECSAWLTSEGVPHQAPIPTNRYPTPAEMTKALSNLPGYRAEISKSLERGSWYANITWAANPMDASGNMVYLSGYRSDDEPERFHISKGSVELALQIAANLVAYCGPLVVTDDCYCIPIVVTADADISALVQDRESRIRELG